MAKKPGFELRFAIDNAAFDGDGLGAEVARILRQVGMRVQNGGDTAGVVFDINGNRIGSWCINKDD